MLRVHTVVLGAACWRQRAEVSQASQVVLAETFGTLDFLRTGSSDLFFAYRCL